jgi:hypothetical protein
MDSPMPQFYSGNIRKPFSSSNYMRTIRKELFLDYSHQGKCNWLLPSSRESLSLVLSGAVFCMECRRGLLIPVHLWVLSSFVDRWLLPFLFVLSLILNVVFSVDSFKGVKCLINLLRPCQNRKVIMQEPPVHKDCLFFFMINVFLLYSQTQ